MIEVIQEILFSLIMLGLAIWIISVSLNTFTDLVIKYKEAFPRIIDPLDQEIYAPIEDYNDGFIEDERNHDNRISEMRAKLDEILKPEIITDEYEREQEL